MKALLGSLLIGLFTCVAVGDVRAEELSIRSRWETLVLENDRKMAADKRVPTLDNVSGSWGPSFEAFGPSHQLMLSETAGMISGVGNSHGCTGVVPEIISGRREGHRIILTMATAFLDSDLAVTRIYEIVAYKGTLGLKFIRAGLNGHDFPSPSAVGYVELVPYFKYMELRAQFEGKLQAERQATEVPASNELSGAAASDG
jgi:hypothetical protein